MFSHGWLVKENGSLGVPHYGGNPPIYGVSWDKSDDPTLIRTDDSVGWTCQVGVDGSIVTNDADNADIYGEFIESTDGYGNTFICIPRLYIEKTDGVGYKTWRISRQKFSATSYLPWCFWDFATGTPLDYICIGKYPGSISGGKLQSISGVYPTINTTIVDFRTAAEANGAGYQQLDIHAVDLLQTLLYIEFATLDLQSIMAGYTSGRYNAADVLTADTSPAANTLVVANATGALYAVGQAISVGTSLGGNQRFYGRTITNIQADTPGAGSTTITFDGAAVEMFTADVLYNSGYKNGDAIAASSGSVSSNSTGKHYCKYRGIVSPYGNLFYAVDGLNINENRGWVCEDADNFASNVFAAPYEQLSYVNHNANGYVTAMGWDSAHNYAALPVAVDAAWANAGYRDYYYQTTGQRIALLGGYWNNGAYAGPGFWFLSRASSSADVFVGARLCRKAG